jgi:hypothetical protein
MLPGFASGFIPRRGSKRVPILEGGRGAFDWPSSDRSTLPGADPGVERASRLLVLVVSIWFALAAGWELAGPFAAGHYAAATAVASGGENMWRWGVLGPVPTYTLVPPAGRDFYCHHPWGIFWTAALFTKVFGHQFFVCRLPAVIMSACMPGLLYAFGRAAWGPIAGAVAALGFSVLPIALSFANFHALEVPVMFGVAICAWAYLRLAQTGRRRWLLLSLAGLLFAENADWAGFVFGAILLAVTFTRGFVFRRFLPPLAARRMLVFWAWAACLSLAVAGFYLIAFQSLGSLEDFLRSGEFRSAGSKLPLDVVLESRRTWIETAFTPLAILLGKLALPVLLLRAFFLRRDGDWLPLAILGMALFQYLAFKQGADIHFFWPHYFAHYFALAMGALAHSTQRLLEIATRARPRLSRFAPWVSLGLFSSALGLILPDGVRALVFARKTAGRFNEKGLIIHPDLDKAAALAFLATRMESSTGVVLHPSMKQSYWMDWLLERPVRTGKTPRGKADGADQYFILDARFTSVDELRSVTKTYAVVAVGPFWYVDRSRGHAAFEAYRVVRRDPGALEAYFVQGSHALRSIEPDPWQAWELSHHFAELPGEVPKAPPTDADQLRIAHNAALAQGDEGRARELAMRLTQGAFTPPCEYDDGTRIQAVRFEPGSSDVLTVTFLAGRARPDERRFRIDSSVEAAPAFSLTPPDPTLREVGLPTVVPAALWKPGYLYASITEVLKRPGRELYFGRFVGAGAPASTSGSDTCKLVNLE